MMARSAVIMRKSLDDFANPLYLAAFFVVYVGVGAFLAIGVTQAAPDDLATMPLHIQEQELAAAFSQLAFLWGVGIPMMVLVSVLAANGIAKESQTGTLRILLSKPIRRWEVIGGKFAAIFLFAVLTMLAGILLSAVLVFHFLGADLAAVSPMALSGGIWALVPGILAYALFVGFVTGAVGTAIAVVTGSRMGTVLATLLIPVVFFAFIPVRLLAGATIYLDYRLYFVDLNYHFGNPYVFLLEALGVEFSPTTQSALGTATGVYDTTGTGVDPLVGGMDPSVPLAGHVPPIVSLLGLLVGAGALLAVAVVYFERADIQ